MAAFTLQVPAPPRATFDYLSDPRHRPQWQSSLRTVHLLDTGPPTVGTRWVDVTSVGARPHLAIVELTTPGTHGQPGAWTEAGHWRGIRARLRLTFTPARGGTHTALGVQIHLTSNRRWLPLRLALQALAVPAVRHDLRRAARTLQARAGDPGVRGA